MRPFNCSSSSAPWAAALLGTLWGALLAADGKLAAPANAQEFGPPDRAAPGDEAMQALLYREAARLEADWLAETTTRQAWEQALPRYREEYLYMLGLWPAPEKTPLEAVVTGETRGPGFVVEKLHFQSRPGLYVTANFYRPAEIESRQRLPAVLYVCGHSGMGRNGNKTAFQSHGIWLARHGYVCLVLDTLQLGEIAATHHGTYREGRWWWHSRGYTPAGVECWNGVRGVDYLLSRPEVDAKRLAVTGISGGGAATLWIAAADPRIAVAIPVSGMADLRSYVNNRVINGHCDCMFCYNTFAWPWTRIAALVAPRPMLFVNSDNDRIFPMDANDRVGNRLERVYSLYGASDRFDTLVSIGGHDYRTDIRQGVFRFLNTHLQDDPREITDADDGLPTRDDPGRRYLVPPEELRVFAADADLPKDQINTRVDELFVPLARVAPPESGKHAAWRQALVNELRRVTFRWFPERVPPAEVVQEPSSAEWLVETEPGARLKLVLARAPREENAASRVWLVAQAEEDAEAACAAALRHAGPGDFVYRLETRGVGATRWTSKNPPNTMERSLALVGRAAAAGRVSDIIAAARWLNARHRQAYPVFVAGRGGAGVLAAYAAALETEIAGVLAAELPASHMQADAPALLNVLRVCDIPDALGLVAPRPLTLVETPVEAFHKTQQIYAAAGAPDRFDPRPIRP